MKTIFAIAGALALAACVQHRGVRSFGDDALPSAEVTAFRQADARLHYAGARIEHDATGCAVYRGTTPAGQVRDEPLLDPAGKAICVRR